MNRLAVSSLVFLLGVGPQIGHGEEVERIKNNYCVDVSFSNGFMSSYESAGESDKLRFLERDLGLIHPGLLREIDSIVFIPDCLLFIGAAFVPHDRDLIYMKPHAYSLGTLAHELTHTLDRHTSDEAHSEWNELVDADLVDYYPDPFGEAGDEIPRNGFLTSYATKMCKICARKGKVVFHEDYAKWVEDIYKNFKQIRKADPNDYRNVGKLEWLYRNDRISKDQLDSSICLMGEDLEN